MAITKTSDHIKIEGHRGKWYVIDEGDFTKGSLTMHLFLLEHETYGDEAACLIVDEDGTIWSEDIWNGFDDLIEQGWMEAQKPVKARPGETMSQFLGRKLLPRR